MNCAATVGVPAAVLSGAVPISAGLTGVTVTFSGAELAPPCAEITIGKVPAAAKKLEGIRMRSKVVPIGVAATGTGTPLNCTTVVVRKLLPTR